MSVFDLTDERGDNIMGKLKYPASIDWEVTSFCNQNCIHCYNCWRSEEDKTKDILFNQTVTEDWYLMISKIIASNKPVSVIITGGEPLSVFWKLDKAIEQLISSGIYVSMNTNLTLINDKMAERIKELGIHIFTSIPSADPEICDRITGVKGSFERIDAGIKLCISYRIPIATNMVVTKLNLPCIAKTAKYLKSLGLDYFCCTKAAFPANAKTDLRNEILSYAEFSKVLSDIICIGDTLKMRVDSAWAYSLCGLVEKQITTFGFKRRCGAGRFNFAITSDGDIKACNVDTKVYGNILVSNFAEAMNKMSAWQNNEYLPAECKTCKSLYLCGGGCRLEAENTYGDKCHLDSTSCVSNKERDIRPPDGAMIEENKLYRLRSDVVFVEENGFFRISRKSVYEYITPSCKTFFDQFPTFSLSEFRKQLELADELAALEFSEFLNKSFFIEVQFSGAVL